MCQGMGHVNEYLKSLRAEFTKPTPVDDRKVGASVYPNFLRAFEARNAKTLYKLVEFAL